MVRTTRHVNAADVLPPRLLTAVQSAVDGQAVSLWIPSHRADEARARAERVVELRRLGRSAKDIAADVGVGERRVHQILAERRPKADRCGR